MQQTHSILESSNLVTLDELAEFLRVTPHALYQQRYRGVEPGNLGFQNGRRVVFWPEDIRDWLDRQRRT